jgi:hypothetical protein
MNPDLFVLLMMTGGFLAAASYCMDRRIALVRRRALRPLTTDKDDYSPIGWLVGGVACHVAWIGLIVAAASA